MAILILHHSNKSNPADFRDSASGAMSLIGGADNFWALSRQPMSEEATLKVTGRDLPREYDLALPLFVLLLLFQKHLVRGLTAGAVKG